MQVVGTKPAVAPVTIASGGSLSPAIDLGTGTLTAIQMPSSWTTANLTFQASADGITYADLYDSDGTERTVDAAASEYICVNKATWAGIRFLKIRSGTSALAVNQGADRSLTLVSVQ